jgi:hypothetical protein
MVEELIRWMRRSALFVRVLKWWFVSMYYWITIAVWKEKALLVWGPVLALAAIALFRDREREASGMDDFHGDWLFFRYGEQVSWAVISIPVKGEWNAEETSIFTRSLQSELTRGIAERLPSGSIQVDEPVITDRKSGETKRFLRTRVRSRFGSSVTHFVHYASFGRSIAAHYFTYLRGTHSDWDVAEFVLFSPFTIWFWGIPWLLNRHSIVASISKFRESSFDGIDLRTMRILTHQVVYEETGRVLEEAGLLTEEVRQILNFHIQNSQNVNLQTLQVAAKDVRMSNVSQSARVPLARQPS